MKKEAVKKWTGIVVYCGIFIAGIACIITGQRRTGAAGLGIMLAGLAAILLLLFLYNRKYQ